MQQATEILFIFRSRKKDILEELLRLNIKKEAPESDIFLKINEESSGIFGDFLLPSFNDATEILYSNSSRTSK